jgi:hypothetical protein
MVCLTGREGQDCVDIRAFEIWIFLKDYLSRLACRNQTENIRDGDAQAANARASMHAIGIYSYSCQKFI